MTKQYKIPTPIGYDSLVQHVETNCLKKTIYQQLGLPLDHFIITCEDDETQNSITKYLARKYAIHELRSFAGLDLYLEFKLDGTLKQMNDVFCEIKSAAIYANNFEGIIAFDISALADSVNESQVTYFLEEVKEISKHATLIFYIPFAESKNMSLLLGKLEMKIINFHKICTKPYEAAEIAQVLMKKISDFGIIIEDENMFYDAVLEFIQREKIALEDLNVTARKILFRANFENTPVKISAKNLEKLNNIKHGLNGGLLK